MTRAGRLISRARWLWVLAALQCAMLAQPASAADYRFRIRLSEKVASQPFTGRVYIFFSQQPRREPRLDPKFIHAEPFVALDVENWKPGETITLASDRPAGMLAYPVPLAEMKLAGFHAQAIARLNPFAPEVGTGEGNGYGPVVPLPFPSDAPAEAEPAAKSEPPAEVEGAAADKPAKGGGAATIDLVVDRVVPPFPFAETRWHKLLKVRSKLLSDFYGREVTLTAAVVLPLSYYHQPERRYPAVFDIPGFGGSYHRGTTGDPNEGQAAGGVEFLQVLLDGTCPLGHHVFADSANNGPWGAALIEEILPAFDQAFRSVAEPNARFLTGASSGGWSSLWVEINYPQHFAGVWADAPDPVDFRDFQQIDLYAPHQNLYYDAAGSPRPLAHDRDQVLIDFKDFAQLESALGDGGQLHSFEAVFSPRGSDGRPRPLWNRETGEVDADVAKAWEKYDIHLVLERNWKTLQPQLQGKLHIHVTDSDRYYLDGAVKLLKQSLDRLGSDAEVVIHPGHNHGAMTSRADRRKLLDEMAAVFLRNHSLPRGSAD